MLLSSALGLVAGPGLRPGGVGLPELHHPAPDHHADPRRGPLEKGGTKPRPESQRDRPKNGAHLYGDCGPQGHGGDGSIFDPAGLHPDADDESRYSDGPSNARCAKCFDGGVHSSRLWQGGARADTARRGVVARSYTRSVALGRTTRLEHDVEHWRGTVRMLLLFAQLLEAEMDIEGEGPRSQSHVSVEYDDGRQEWESLTEFRASVDNVIASKVRSMQLNLDRAEPSRLTLVILASCRNGVHVVVEGERSLLVHGLIEEARRLMEKGRVPDVLPGRRPIGLGDWVAGFVSVLTVAGMLLFALALGSPWWLIASSAGGIALTLAVLVPQILEPLKVEAPALELLTKAEAAAGGKKPREDPPGPILRAAAWLRRHPGLALLGTFILGILTNVVADAITRA